MAGLFQRGSVPPDQEQPAPAEANGSPSPAADSSSADASAPGPNGHASTTYPAPQRTDAAQHQTGMVAREQPSHVAPLATASSPDGRTAAPATHQGWSRWKSLLAIAAVLVAIAMVVAVYGVAGHSSAGGNPGVGPASAVVVPPSANALQQNVINVIHVVQPSVVEVAAHGTQGGGIGSGEILRTDGYIVTNNHVVNGFTDFTVTLANGQTVPAQVIGTAPQDDLAVLKIQADHLRAITVGDSREVQVGQFAVAIGSPLGLQQSATIGIVSALDRQAGEAQGGPMLVGLIQTSAPINPGNSGGALVDLQGHLIGIPTLGAVNPESGAPAAGIGFAIPSDRMKFITDQIIQYGHVVNTGQGFLGVQGIDVTAEIAAAYQLPVQSGVLVVGFANDASGTSPAQLAGMQRGDIIVGVSGQPITSQADLAAALLTEAPGTQMLVNIQRGASQQTIKVKLGERPVQP